jgi:UDP-N-acetylmuramate dehydrogenase
MWLYMSSLLTRLPKVRGRYREGAELAKSNWFQVGGPAEVLFKPEDKEDLADFLKQKPKNVPVTVLGVGSNIIVRDGGIEGVVIKLGRGFAGCEIQGTHVTAGAGCLDVNVANAARDAGMAGLEFLSGIPGTIGGALMMNAGAYGREIAEVLESVEVVTGEGEIKTLEPGFFQYSYRHSEVPEGWIFAGAVLKGEPGDPVVIGRKIEEIQKAREESQPIRSRTGGSTFRNPSGHKAWELIDKAGCRGLRLNDAQVSEKHCNFLINHGAATAAELERLGEIVREKVKAQSGIELEWEIKRIGM